LIKGENGMNITSAAHLAIFVKQIALDKQDVASSFIVTEDVLAYLLNPSKTPIIFDPLTSEFLTKFYENLTDCDEVEWDEDEDGNEIETDECEACELTMVCSILPDGSFLFYDTRCNNISKAYTVTLEDAESAVAEYEGNEWDED
jgi:hypothetical protein